MTLFSLKCGLAMLFAFGQSVEDAEKNIIFVNKSETWPAAKDYCFDNDSILAGNENTLNTYRGSVGRVWTGVFEIITPWAAIAGCFQLKNVMEPLIVPFGEYLECQRLCPLHLYSYFTLKGASCYCLHSIKKLLESSFKNCDDPHAKNHFFLIHNQNITIDRAGNSADGQCLSAQCEGQTLKHFSERCSTTYAVICVNGTTVESVKFNAYHGDGMTRCKQMNSYIKWYPDEICEGQNLLPNQHWTSGTRFQKPFTLRKSDQYQNVAPLVCQSGYLIDGNLAKLQFENCSERLPFFCTNSQEAKDSATGLAVGVAVAVVVLVSVGIAIGIILYKRRNNLDKASPNTTETAHKPSNDHGKKTTTLYQDIDPNQLCSNQNKNATNFVYFSQPSHNEQSQNTAFYDMPTSSTHKDIENSDHNIDVSLKSKNENTTYNQTTNTSDYCLAKPAIDHEEIDPYTDNTEYYHLNNVAKTTNTSDYCLAEPGLDHEDIDPYTDNTDYDHLNNVAKKESVLCTLKIYDHLPTSVDSDPTYDRADIKMFKAKNGNYDSFTVQ